MLEQTFHYGDSMFYLQNYECTNGPNCTQSASTYSKFYTHTVLTTSLMVCTHYIRTQSCLTNVVGACMHAWDNWKHGCQYMVKFYDYTIRHCEQIRFISVTHTLVSVRVLCKQVIHILTALCYAGVMYAETDVAIICIVHSPTFFPNCIGTQSPYRQEITMSTVWTTVMYFCLSTGFFLMNKNFFANMYIYCK